MGIALSHPIQIGIFHEINHPLLGTTISGNPHIPTAYRSWGSEGARDPGTGSPQHSMESPRLCPLLEDQWAAYMRTVSLGLDSDISRKPFKLRLFGDEIITKADMVSSDVDLTSIISI